MAPSTTITTDWMFSGRQAYLEFEENEATNEIRMRRVRVFRRFRVEAKSGDYTNVEAQLGDEDGGLNVWAYMGDNKIYAGVISVGTRKKWVCVKEDNEPGDPHCDWFRRSQEWEQRDPYEAYTWPT